MPGVAFLDLSQGKIIGESQNYPNYIELDSYSFGASNPANVGSGGLSGGTVSCSDFSFSCEVDSASGAILDSLFTGQTIPTAVFKLIESTGVAKSAQPAYITVTFTNCYITSHSFGGSGDSGKPTQNISFAYEQIDYEYSGQSSSSGALANKANAGFNVAQGQSTK